MQARLVLADICRVHAHKDMASIRSFYHGQDRTEQDRTGQDRVRRKGSHATVRRVGSAIALKLDLHGWRN